MSLINPIHYTVYDQKVPKDRLPEINITSDSMAWGTIEMQLPIDALVSTSAKVWQLAVPSYDPSHLDRWSRLQPEMLSLYPNILDHTSVLLDSGYYKLSWHFNPSDMTPTADSSGNCPCYSVEFFVNADTSASSDVATPKLIILIEDPIAFTGITGIQATTGSVFQGETGVQGITGIIGSTGVQGPTGIQGHTGLGVQGYTGFYGQTGIQGETGIQGLTGFYGQTGLQGETGIYGETGIQGLTGFYGQTGIQGKTGLGLQGETGLQGVPGMTGIPGGGTGVQGPTGFYGQTGIQGLTGFYGQTGIQGVTGFYGRTGIQGQTGIQGTTGISGITGFYGQTGIRGMTGIASSDNYGADWVPVWKTGLPVLGGYVSGPQSLALSSDGRYQSLTQGIPYIDSTSTTNDVWAMFNSSDYGQTWILDNTDWSPCSVAVSSSGNYRVKGVLRYNSGNMGSIWTSSDSGQTWTERFNQILYWRPQCFISDSGQYQIATGGGISTLLYESTNFGVDWSGRDSSRYWLRAAMSSDASYQLASVASTGYLYRSINSGNDWSTVSSSLQWQDVAVSGTGQYQVATAYNNGVYTSSNYGLTWSGPKPYPTSENRRVAMSKSGQHITVADDRYVYRSSDYGESFVYAYDSSASVSGVAEIEMSDGGGFQVILGWKQTYPRPLPGYFGIIISTSQIQGQTGIQGPQGIQGTQGITGLKGLTGFYGQTGIQGVTGFYGRTGIQGTGQTGLQGQTGIKGTTGLQGIQGEIGNLGQTGIGGPTGVQGQTGLSGGGTTGLQGTTGVGSPTGVQGQTGLYGGGTTGLQGPTGIGSPTGIQGQTGLSGGGDTGIQGPIGPAGQTGLQGLQGPGGSQGVTGIFGLTGVQGVTGFHGQTGVQGLTGFYGRTGIQGITGFYGQTGIRGVTGFYGQTGVQGLTGFYGQTGVQGITGFYGQTGIQGTTGPSGGGTGLQGPTGIDGQTGIQGLTGQTGIQGVTGFYGRTGIQGLTGFYGQTGIRGTTGIQGTTGLVGITGLQAYTYYEIKRNSDADTTTVLDSYLEDGGGPYYPSNRGISNSILVGPGIWAGYTSYRTGMIKFNDIPDIPIIDAKISAYLIGTQLQQGVDSSVIVYRCLSEWKSDETDAEGTFGPTWDNREYETTTAWDKTGCSSLDVDIDSTPMCVAHVQMNANDTNPGYRDFPFTDYGVSCIKSMMSGSLPNYGFALKDTSTNNYYVFYSSNVTDPAKRPKLVLNYATQGPSGSTGIQGETGVQGVTGLVGQTGIQGIQGEIGNLGYTGIQGETGLIGSTGSEGQTGIQGYTGLAFGATGLQGNTGLVGETGIQGVTGFYGQTGIQGFTGFYGQTGVQGLTGFYGQTGLQGLTGFYGDTGVQGLTGFYGQTGVQGPQGSGGSQGVTGFYGRTGIQGQTGIQGETGLQGNTGLQGQTGIVSFSTYGGATGIIGDVVLPYRVYFGDWAVTMDSSGTIDCNIYNTPYATHNTAPYLMGVTGIGIYVAGVKAQGTNYWGGVTGAAGNVVRVDVKGTTVQKSASLHLGYYRW